MTDFPYGNDAFPTGVAPALSPVAQEYSRHGGRADIARALIARMLDRTLSARWEDLPGYLDESGLLSHMIPDDALHHAMDEAAGMGAHGMIADMVEVISAFSRSFSPAETYFIIRQALSRAGRDRLAELDIPVPETVHIRTRHGLLAAFAREVSGRMIEFAAGHFGEPLDGTDTLVHFVIGQEIWYLSDKFDDVAVGILEEAYALDGEHGVFSRLCVWLRPDIDVPAMERMRRHLVIVLGMPGGSSNVFLRFARPYLDTAYARCFARYMRHSEQSTR